MTQRNGFFVYLMPDYCSVNITVQSMEYIIEFGWTHLLHSTYCGVVVISGRTDQK